jgi:hypothetical protein
MPGTTPLTSATTGCRLPPTMRSSFVDIMWIIVYTTVYIL